MKNTANVETAWESPYPVLQRIQYSEMIWSAAIAWLAGFFLAGSVAIAVAGCTGNVTHLPYPDEAGTPPSPIQLGSAPIEESDPEPPKCFKRDRLVLDGGVIFDVPLPCDPTYDARHDWGDPQP